MAEYNRKPQPSVKRGINISLPGDRLAQEWLQYAQNLRSYIYGEWRQRPGLALVDNVAASGIYHINRINNIDNSFRRVAATQAGDIYFDNAAHNNFVLADSGFSGKIYSSVISRPDRSPAPYFFLASDTRNSKFDPVGVRTEWGLAAPLDPAEVNGQGITYKVVVPNTSSGVADYGDFVIDADHTVSPTEQFAPGAGQTEAILYDSGTSGMAIIALADSIGEGVFTLEGTLLTLIDFLTFNPVYTSIVQEIGPKIPNTTIDQIQYDLGSMGLCTIKLTNSTDGLKRNCILRITNGGAITEYVRVLSVSRDLTGMPYVRCSTTNTFTSGNTVQGRFSIRLWVEGNPVIPGNGATTGTYFSSLFLAFNPTINAGLATATLTYPASTNFATTDTNNGGLELTRLIQDGDYFHINMLGTYSAISEVQIQFDIEDGTFINNYYYISVRPSDLIGSIDQTQLSINAQQLQVQRDQLDEFVATSIALGLQPPTLDELGDVTNSYTNNLFSNAVVTSSNDGSVSIPAVSGGAQWQQFYIPISQFQRVGAATKSWKDVVAFRVTANFTTTDSNTSFAFGSIWIGGSYGPDTIGLPGYTYVYRARNSETGSRSNPSPPIRYQINSKRTPVRLDIPPYSDPQADTIDIFRIGGILTTYQLVSSVNNPSVSFFDDIPDSIAIRNPSLEIDRFKPWVTSDLPTSGICNVIGTTVLRQSGDPFSTEWVRGTQIIIDNNVYTLYTNPSSTDRLELNESGGVLVGVGFQIPEPVRDGQTYPVVFSLASTSSAEFIFALGDPNNPGFLYWSNGNDPESTSDVNFLEVCSPSERLMNGCVLDGTVYVFSERGSWRIFPSFSGGQTTGGADFYPQKTAMGKGVACRWGLTVGDAIYWISYDGIYRSRGDAVESLTDDSLAPVFRREGTTITPDVPISPIALTTANENEHTLTYCNDGLYFTYLGEDANYYTFYYSFFTKGWVLDSISSDNILRSYREVSELDSTDDVLVGTSNGNILIRSTAVFQDNSQNIACRFWDREEIWDDLRSTKQVGDTMIDIAPQGASITPNMRYDANTSNDVLSTITGTGRDQFVRDINAGSGRVVRGAALDLTWNDGTSGIPKVYAWEPAALVKSEETVNRASDWDGGGYSGTKWLQGFRLRGDTAGLTKSFQVEIDGGTFVESFTFTANGEQIQTFWLNTPVVCHEMRILGTDNDSWRYMGMEWIFEPEPEMAAVWETQVTNLDLPFFSHIREMMIANRSTTDITMTVTTDGVSNTYTIPNGGGERVRTYLPLLAIKAKYHKFRFTSSQPFGLWIMDLETKAGNWGRVEAYATIKPFGDISRQNGGARI